MRETDARARAVNSGGGERGRGDAGRAVGRVALRRAVGDVSRRTV